MMYFSKEELMLVKELLEGLFNDGFTGVEEEDLYIKVIKQLDDMK